MDLLEMSRERPRPERSRAFAAVALVVVGLAAFQATAVAYYHLFRLGDEFDRNLLTRVVVAAHDAVGLFPSLLLAGLAGFWATAAFVQGPIRAPFAKVVGIAGSALLVAAFLGVAEGPADGGTLGATVGSIVRGVVGRGGGMLLFGAAAILALALATERFFAPPSPARKEPRTPPPSPSPRGPKPVPIPGTLAGVTGVETETLLGERDLEGDEGYRPASEGSPAAPSRSGLPGGSAVEDEASETESEAERRSEERHDDEEELQSEEAGPERQARADGPIAGGGDPSVDLAGSRAPSPGSAEAPDPSVEEEERRGGGRRERRGGPLEPDALGDPEGAKEGAEESGEAASSFASEEDLVRASAEAIFEAGRASVSVLQQGLGIPFIRASRLLDRLERKGLVGPYRGGSARDILLAREEWEERLGRA